MIIRSPPYGFHRLPMTDPIRQKSAEKPPDEPVLVRLAPGTVQTIEQTGKLWKGIMALSALLFVLGITGCALAVVRDPRAVTDPPLLSWIGGVAALAGFIGLLIGKLGAWWYHG